MVHAGVIREKQSAGAGAKGLEASRHQGLGGRRCFSFFGFAFWCCFPVLYVIPPFFGGGGKLVNGYLATVRVLIDFWASGPLRGRGSPLEGGVHWRGHDPTDPELTWNPSRSFVKRASSKICGFVFSQGKPKGNQRDTS